MPVAFGHSDLMRAAPTVTVVAGTVADGMPLSNLQDEQPGIRARLFGDPVAILIDFGSAVTVGLVLLGNTTLDSSGVMHVAGSLTDPSAVAAEVIDASVATTDPDRSRGQAVLLLPADVSLRYLRIEIAGPPGGVVDLGVLAVMRTLRLPKGPEFGAFDGRIPMGVRDRNAMTGATFSVPGLAAPRVARYSLPYLEATEYYGTLRAMLDDLTVADSVVWVPDTALTQAELNRRCIYGALLVPGQDSGITRHAPRLGTAALAIEERV